ncbi:hypothetical protein, partial [Streptomyces sp. NPDC051994]|uniref:hypothetical protein n=1 Tax=Streptomyces sp. NPDC051994 TaxID=3155287 RepID=UPI00342510FC
MTEIPDPLAPFRVLADRCAAKAAESTRHAEIATDDEIRTATQGLAAGWRSAEFLLRHTLTSLDNGRTTPDRPAGSDDTAARNILVAICERNGYTPPPPGIRITTADLAEIDAKAERGVPFGEAVRDVIQLAARRVEKVAQIATGPTVCAHCGDSITGYPVIREWAPGEPSRSWHGDRPECDPHASGDARRRALARNAVGPALKAHGEWLPLSVREAIADAVLAVRDEELEQLRKERDMLGRETDRLRRDWTAMRDRADTA